jgi:aspartokinase-like uncharacterized kinase
MSMATRPVWVIKLGGSLLGSTKLSAEIPNLRTQAKQMLVSQSPPIDAFNAQQSRIKTLQTWLDIMAIDLGVQIVIVPGGGLFADAVREAQAISGFDDAVAHHLALQAMAQFGTLLASMHSAFVTVDNLTDIAKCASQRQTMIWLPTDMVLSDLSIAKSWQVTSDSLSVWLARKIHAQSLVIVKSVPFLKDQLLASAMQNDGRSEAVNVLRSSSTIDCLNKISDHQGHDQTLQASVLSAHGVLDAAFSTFLDYEDDHPLEVRVVNHQHFESFKKAISSQSLKDFGHLVIG